MGVPRILSLLDRYEVPASFFMPAVCALLRPDEAPRYIDAGHEVALHGWIHERDTLLTYADELDLLGRAHETLTAQTGVPPVGIRTPAWDFSDSTMQVIADLGLTYDSSLMADDEPYELLADGRPTSVVEIPVDWTRDDAASLLMNQYGAPCSSMSPRQLLDIWKDEFDDAYAEGGLFQLTLHPYVIGHRSRLLVLDRLLRHIRTYDKVWFATHADLARHVFPSPNPDRGIGCISHACVPHQPPR